MNECLRRGEFNALRCSTFCPRKTNWNRDFFLWYCRDIRSAKSQGHLVVAAWIFGDGSCITPIFLFMVLVSKFSKNYFKISFYAPIFNYYLRLHNFEQFNYFCFWIRCITYCNTIFRPLVLEGSIVFVIPTLSTHFSSFTLKEIALLMRCI